ncbi:hypothetical protein [Micromonospora sp. NPDC023633]|uniref:hypothetical protein n=1 Tax=Micromonospora sp. NPDC023633 TaxID=3154320 RepID=UPI0033D244DE
MAIDWGDAPAWSALGLSAVGTIIPISSARSSRASARSAEISAQAGVRQAAAAEEQVAIARESLRLAGGQSASSHAPTEIEAVQEALAQEPPYVAWWIEFKGHYLYALCNIGTATARNVEIDESRIGRGCSFKGQLKTLQMAPGQERRFKITYWWPSQRPRELWVRWQGHPEWKAIQVPLKG